MENRKKNKEELLEFLPLQKILEKDLTIDNVEALTLEWFKFYKKYKGGFRKTLLFNNIIPDPFGKKLEKEEFELLIKRFGNFTDIKIECEHTELGEFKNEIDELILAYTYFYDTVEENTMQLYAYNIDEFCLSKTIQIICTSLQVSQYSWDMFEGENNSNFDFITPMKTFVHHEYSDQLYTSPYENLEITLEGINELLPYLYYKKKSDFLKCSLVVNQIVDEDLEKITKLVQISIDRIQLKHLWEKFMLAGWKMSTSNNPTVHRKIEAKNIEQEQRRLIGNYRRNYTLQQTLCSYRINTEHDSFIFKIIEEFEISDIYNFYSLSKNDYTKLTSRYKTLIDAYIWNMPLNYRDLKLGILKVSDIINVYTLLIVFNNIYTEAVKKESNLMKNSSYHLVAPQVELDFFIKCICKFYELNDEYATKLIEIFVYTKGLKDEHDIFSRPLILINKQSVVYTPCLIEQMNLERIISTQISTSNKDISEKGAIFEGLVKLSLGMLSQIKVNTTEMEFEAYDKKMVEFDFLGTFEDYLLVFELKSITVPYNEKKFSDAKNRVEQAIEQIERRCLVIQKDWDKIKTLANIPLPSKPFPEKKIIKLVVTDILEFTNYNNKGVQVVDSSTLLKFFTNPKIEVKMAGSNEVRAVRSLWTRGTPTVTEFLYYLKNPNTTAIFNSCFKSVEQIYGDKYKIEVIKNILEEDPYEKEIRAVLSAETKQKKKKKKKKK